MRSGIFVALRAHSPLRADEWRKRCRCHELMQPDQSVVFYKIMDENGMVSYTKTLCAAHDGDSTSRWTMLSSRSFLRLTSTSRS